MNLYNYPIHKDFSFDYDHSRMFPLNALEQEFLLDFYHRLSNHTLYWNRLHKEFHLYSLVNFPKNAFTLETSETERSTFGRVDYITGLELDLSTCDFTPEFSDSLFKLSHLRFVCIYHSKYRQFLETHSIDDAFAILSGGHGSLVEATKSQIGTGFYYYGVPASDPEGFSRMLSYILISGRWHQFAITVLTLENMPPYPRNMAEVGLSTNPDERSFPYTPDSPDGRERLHLLRYGYSDPGEAHIRRASENREKEIDRLYEEMKKKKKKN